MLKRDFGMTPKAIEHSTNIKLFVYSALMASIGSLLSWHVNGRQPFGIDDAHIFINYASNLSGGDGLIYSSGIPKVEGFTSFLWVIILAVMIKLGGTEPHFLIISITILSISQYYYLRILSYDRSGKVKILPLVLYSILLFSSIAYLSWTTITLMDVALYGWLISAFLFVLLVPKQNGEFRFNLAILALFVSFWIRPEAIVIGFVSVTLILLTWGKVLSLQRKILLGLTLFISVSSLTLFRVIYFGELLPNTFYAKVSPSFREDFKFGIKYLAEFISIIPVHFFLAFGIVFASIYVISFDKNRRFSILSPKGVFLLTVFLTVQMSIPVITGGDHFGYFRFFQAGFPILCVLIVIALVEISNRFLVIFSKFYSNRVNSNPKLKLSYLRVILLVIAVLILGQNNKLSWYSAIESPTPIKHEFGIANYGMSQGTILNTLFSSRLTGYPSIGVVTAGGVSRTYEGSIYDLMGLNNHQMAHNQGQRIGVKNHAAFEKETFYTMPINILFGSPEFEFFNAVYKDLFLDAEFTNEWVHGTLSLLGPENVQFSAFYNKVFLDELLKDSRYVFKDDFVFSKNEGAWEKTN